MVRRPGKGKADRFILNIVPHLTLYTCYCGFPVMENLLTIKYMRFSLDFVLNFNTLLT